MQSVSSRIWIRVAVSISFDDNDYTTGTSITIIPRLVSVITVIHIAIDNSIWEEMKGLN